MTTTRRLVTTALWTALAALVTAQLPAADLFFVQMSDPQFGMYSKDRDFAQETANFEFAIANVNRLHPAFVIVCGDLVNRAGDAAQIHEYLRIADKLDRSIPIYNVAGNHDVGNEPTPASLELYRKSFGHDYYTFRSADFLGIVLNSSLIQHPEKAAKQASAQEQWLKSELEKARKDGVRRMAVFQHIPLFLEKADEPDQYFNIPLRARARLLELFAAYDVNYVFAGHYHRNAYGESAALKMVTNGPVGMPLGRDPSGIRVVVAGDSKMESRYYGLGNIPNQVDLVTIMKP